MAHLYLASKSEIRSRLLTDAGFFFTQMDSGVDEEPLKKRLSAIGSSPSEIAFSLAIEKSLSVARRSNEFTIGADQILDCDGEIFSKTRNEQEVRERLERLSGKRHWLHTGVCICLGPAIVMRAVETAQVYMRYLSSSDLDRICEHGDHFIGTLGGYRSEAKDFEKIAHYDGHSSTVLGLPVPLIASFFRSHKTGD